MKNKEKLEKIKFLFSISLKKNKFVKRIISGRLQIKT